MFTKKGLCTVVVFLGKTNGKYYICYVHTGVMSSLLVSMATSVQVTPRPTIDSTFWILKSFPIGIWTRCTIVIPFAEKCLVDETCKCTA